MEDENFKAINLVSSDGFKKWLSHPKERSGETSVTLQLENECTISYIDIGAHWCASIEIQVGRSDWPIGKEYQILAPTCIMMKPMDCNLGRNFACTRMFSEKDFNNEVASHLWDRIRIICRQPLKRDKQFGLSFLRVKTANTQNSSDISSTSQQKSVQSIQKHFFGKTKISNSPGNEMKTKLLKMVGSSENGTEQEKAMSRTAKLVLAASIGSKPKESVSNKSPFYSDMLAQKHGPEFQEEVSSFLSGLTINEDELDRVTIADLRHKLERKKRRKLDKDERKTFAEMARNYICKLFGDSDDEKLNSGKSKDNSGKFCESDNKNNVNEREITHIKSKVKSPCGKLDTSRTKAETYGDFEIMSDLSSPKPTDDRKNTNIVDQLKKIRQNAHQIYKTNLEKKQSDENYSPSHHSSQNIEGLKYKNVKKMEDDVYKSMTYLERKAFAMTNPYNVNRYGTSLSFGPSKGKNDDDDDMSPIKSPLSNTNNEWLSKVNQMLMSPPSTGGKRKRGSNGARGGKASKVPRNLEKNDYTSPVQSKGRGKGKSVRAKEVIPTSFERCPNCKETFPPTQFSNHKRTCISDRCGSPDIVEVANSEPTVVDNLRSPEYVECPMCSEFYSADVVQFHAAVCGDV